MTTPDQPRHARAEIRAFAKELRKGGWVYERNDAKGHTLWSHPRASGLYKLAETPSHFSVQRARRDVLALLGEKPQGKRRPKEARAVAAPAPRPAVVTRAAPLRRQPSRLPWEGQPEDYSRSIDALMRRAPGGR